MITPKVSRFLDFLVEPMSGMRSPLNEESVERGVRTVSYLSIGGPKKPLSGTVVAE